MRPPRRAADPRRGGHRLRPHRQDVRLRARGRVARPALPRQGHHRRLPAAGGHARDRGDLRGLPRRATRSSAPSSTATPTPATRSPAPRRSRRSTCSREERTLERLQPKIDLLGAAARADRRAPRGARGAPRGFMVGIELAEHPLPARIGPPGHARGAPPRRDHPPARRRGRADAAAVDLRRTTCAASWRSPPRRSTRRPVPQRCAKPPSLARLGFSRAVDRRSFNREHRRQWIRTSRRASSMNASRGRCRRRRSFPRHGSSRNPND